MGDPATADDDRLIEQFFKKRGKAKGIFRIDEEKDRTYALTPVGEALARAVVAKGGGGEEVSQLTPELLKDGAWRGKTFRKYNIGLRPSRVYGGKRHPYRAFLDEVKTRLVSMGFEEMRGSLVENEFWNMDALYMPQFHPAREIHDVYFVREPRESRPIPEPFATNVARAHENGTGTGSSGWRYPFDAARARRLVLRSQGTAVSARTMAAGPKVPGKYSRSPAAFATTRSTRPTRPTSFRSGIVLGEDITFAHCSASCGCSPSRSRARRRSSSAGVFPLHRAVGRLHARHPKLGWMELGGAVVPSRSHVSARGEGPLIAWGLGLDRMAMTALGSTIRTCSRRIRSDPRRRATVAF
jgi:phenylalanyl-tRNA synthetase alpha chain